jgi:DNA-binding transcriptional ArsR family regulator
MARYAMTPELLALVADRFKALAEPARLRILSELREGERNVTELMQVTGLAQPNVSRHLQLLHRHGFVERRKEGLNVLYRLSGEDVLTLCDIMCGRLAREAKARSRMLSAR